MPFWSASNPSTYSTERCSSTDIQMCKIIEPNDSSSTWTEDIGSQEYGIALMRERVLSVVRMFATLLAATFLSGLTPRTLQAERAHKASIKSLSLRNSSSFQLLVL
ncbi:hypothetical protein EYZ11_000190 [Aspergillus tanneri]|uniref:Uncharacterized protein n=1 Tax=Aspergillus tanneri TaxID=1220188 RepID=A0A4S3JXM8_9EURO|nr:hypothetical protein EYZ11_000190 [Aspergillus tanneri]